MHLLLQPIPSIDIPFGGLVNFMVKAAIASIPAGIIFGVILGGLYAILAFIRILISGK